MILTKPIISLFDRNFDHNTIFNNRLSIRAFPDGFSFSVKNLEESRYVGFEYYQFDKKNGQGSLAVDLLKEITVQKQWLKERFGEVVWVCTEADNIFCPKALNMSENELKHYMFNLELAPFRHLEKDDLNNLGVYNFFTVASQVKNTLKEIWTDSKIDIQHFNSLLLYHLHVDFINRGSESMVYLHIDENHFDIFVFDQYRFKMYNQFQFKTAEDFIYFLMNVYHQLNLKPEHVGVTFLGKIERQSDLYRKTYRYVRNLSFIRLASNMKLSYIFDQLSEHRYYSFFCG
ncbi:MAG: DUF3822 family protein [Bacteroidales bacterium]